MASSNSRNSFSAFLNISKTIIIQIQSLFDEGSLLDHPEASLDALENLAIRMDEVCSTFLVILNRVDPGDDHHWQNVSELLTVLTRIKEDINNEAEKLRVEETVNVEHNLPQAAQTSRNGGRPRYEIDEDQVTFLRSKHFSWSKIAKMLGISDRTLRRKRKEFNTRQENFTCISEEELCEVVQSVRNLTPNIGQSRMLGALRSRGLHIQRWKVRQCLRKLDPIGTALRGHVAVYRRRYSVPYPNYLWHLDGNHKLIHWRLVVHACIDGFSRMIIYLTCANNNLASTVLSSFEEGVSEYGLPMKIRTDHGLENVYAARYMLQHRGTGRGSVLTGRSVHNVRVERLHRDAYSGVLCHYASLFSHMENQGILNADSEEHLFVLHQVFLPRINQSLNEFVNQCNSHPVSSAQNQSPEQMFISGALNSANGQSRGVYCPVVENSETTGTGFDDDYEFPESENIIHDEDYAVFVPQIESCNIPDNSIPNDQFLEDDGNHGINHFLSFLDTLQTRDN